MLIGTTKCIVECDKILIFFGGGGVYGLQLNVFLLFVPMAIYDILVKNNVWFFYPKLIFVRSFMLFFLHFVVLPHQNQDNVFEWSDMSTCGLLFQGGSAIKILLSMLVIKGSLVLTQYYDAGNHH